jgi:hypothetical protein
MQRVLDTIQARINSGELTGTDDPRRVACEALVACLQRCGAAMSPQRSEPPEPGLVAAACAELPARLLGLAGDAGGFMAQHVAGSLAGTAALQAQLTESEAANYELAGMVKQLRAAAAAGSATTTPATKTTTTTAARA